MIVVERPVDSEPTCTQSVSTVPEDPQVPSEAFIVVDSSCISKDAAHGMEIISMTIAKAVQVCLFEARAVLSRRLIDSVAFIIP